MPCFAVIRALELGYSGGMVILANILGGLPLWTLLIICPMMFAAGFVDSIGGGGGLISLPAYILCGMPPHASIATNKLSSLMGTSLTTFKFARNGYLIWWLCAPAVAAALTGSFIGARLSLIASDYFLMVFMLAAAPFAAAYVVSRKELESDKPRFTNRRTVALCMFIALATGMYDGFYGPGAGTFMLLLLTGVARLDVFRAAGVTKAINLTTNVTAFVVFLLGGQVVIGLGLIGGVFNIAGNYVGANLFAEKGAAIVRPIILVVLAIFTIRIVTQLFVAF